MCSGKSAKSHDNDEDGWMCYALNGSSCPSKGRLSVSERVSESESVHETDIGASRQLITD